MKTLTENNARELYHSKRVSELSEACAKKMNLSEVMINQTRLAGLMHDIGKIGIDEEIINKTSQINKAEYEEVKKHAAIGYRILNSVQEFTDIAVYVLNHHERWDGSGYPKGLKGEEISIPGRIIALADSFDAMVKDRTYKRILSDEEAIRELQKCAGSQFDPDITEVFVQMIMEMGKSELV